MANTVLSRYGRTFTLQEGNRKEGLDHLYYFSELVKYFHQYESNFNPAKDIFLGGPVGSGKTFMMELFGKFNADPLKPGQPFHTPRYRKINAQYLANQYQIHGPVAFKEIEDYSVNLLIDDIGTEDVKKSYGTEMNVMEYVISVRYDLWLKHRTVTHYTGNGNQKELNDRYGERSLSRLKDQCTMALYAGEDKRGK